MFIINNVSVVDTALQKMFHSPQNEVWVFMELMVTCLQTLCIRLQSPIPEDIVCKMVVSVSLLL